jgi:hypothetical protein
LNRALMLLIPIFLLVTMSCGSSLESEEDLEEEETSGDEAEPAAEPLERADLIVVALGDSCTSQPLPARADERTRMASCLSMLYGAAVAPRCDWKRNVCKGEGYAFDISQSRVDPKWFDAYVIGPDPFASIEEGFHWEETGEVSYSMRSDAVFANQGGTCYVVGDTAHLCPIGKRPGEPSDLEYALQQQAKQKANGAPNPQCRMAAWWFGSQPAPPHYGKMFEECSKLFFPDEQGSITCTRMPGRTECDGPRDYELRIDESGQRAELRFAPDAERPSAVLLMALADEKQYLYGIAVVANFLPEGKIGACEIKREQIERCIIDAPDDTKNE